MPAHSLGATCQAGARFLTCERRLAGTRTRSSTESPSARCEIGTRARSLVPANDQLAVFRRGIVGYPTQASGLLVGSQRAPIVGSLPAQRRTLSTGATAAWRREAVMRAAPLCISGMRAAAFQFFGNCSELAREFEQRLPRVDLRRLFRELQAFFGMLSAFFRRWHDGDPNLCNVHPGGIVPLPPLPMNRIVSDSILDDPEHWQERAEEARSIAEQMSDPDSKRMMLRIAQDYDRLAAHARRRMKGSAAQS